MRREEAPVEGRGPDRGRDPRADGGDGSDGGSAGGRIEPASPGEDAPVDGGPRLAELLERTREREKVQTLFYRALAAEAADRGEEDLAERFNELHADEQHHLSRITARLLELGERPADLSGSARPAVSYGSWPGRAREREEEEVAWYRSLLDVEGLDGGTRRLVMEILESERRHREHLGGKWMSA